MHPAARLGAIHAVLDDISALVGAPALVEDAEHVVIAYSQHQDAGDPVRASTILGRRATPAVVSWLRSLDISRAQRAVRVPANSELGMQPRVCLPLRDRGQELLGYLWFIDEDMDMSEFDLDRAESSAQVLVGLLRPGSPVGGPASSAALRDALTGVPVDSPVLDRLVDRRLETDGHLRVLTVRATGTRPSARTVRQALTGFVRGLATAAPITAVVDDIGRVAYVQFAGGPDGVGVARQMTSRHGGVVVGVGDPVRSVGALPHASRTALDASRCAAIWPELGPVVAWADAGLYRLVPQLASPTSALVEVVEAMRDLLRNPEQQHLAGTAEVYLDLAGHAQETARALTLHRTTLYQRLQRFVDVTGLDLREGEGRTLAHLALKAARFGEHAKEGAP